MQKKSDALSTAWETLSAPVVAADAAMKDKAKQKEKEHKSLQLAVQRNVRERQARQIAKGMPVKVSSVNKNAMSRIGGQPEGLLSRLKTLEKRAIHRHISHLMDDLPKTGPTKGIKITKKTISVKPVAKVTKVKKPVTVCAVKKEKKAYVQQLGKVAAEGREKQADDRPPEWHDPYPDFWRLVEDGRELDSLDPRNNRKLFDSRLADYTRRHGSLLSELPEIGRKFRWLSPDRKPLVDSSGESPLLHPDLSFEEYYDKLRDRVESQRAIANQKHDSAYDAYATAKQDAAIRESIQRPDDVRNARNTTLAATGGGALTGGLLANFLHRRYRSGKDDGWERPLATLAGGVGGGALGYGISQLLKKGNSREKQAFLAWGGGELGLHPEDKGVGGSVGYTNLLGLLPIPTASIDVGDKKRGVQVGAAPVFKYGPSLSNAPDTSSLAPYLGLRWNHPRKSGLSRQFPRGLPEIIYDKLKGRTRDDAVRLSYPEEYAEAPEKEEKEEGDDIQALLAGLSEDGDGDGKINDGTEDEVEVTERADV